VERAKRSLSQNFLVDPNIRRKIVAELEADSADAVLEVGPGHGELTDLLVGHVERLVLIEKDDDLAAELIRRFRERPDVTVVHGDALQIELADRLGPDRPVRLISNVPYGITSPLIFRFLDLRPIPRRMVLMVQKEVADRISAPEGSKVYGALSVGVQARARVRVAFKVGRRSFRPEPRVDSAVIVLEPRPDAPGPAGEADLRVLTRVAFSRRRKQLGTILRTAPEYRLPSEEAESLLRKAGLSPQARPETVSPDRFVDLARRLRQIGLGHVGDREPGG
jgi:16S rRNA (adenine1518-N6/adenine1519-N6)-dimethyltransferase